MTKDVGNKIIVECNYMGNHSVNPLFTYSSKFTVDKKHLLVTYTLQPLELAIPSK